MQLPRSRQPLPLIVERRVREASQSLKASEIASRSTRNSPPPPSPKERPPAALTRRERKVKAILLKELERINGKQWGSGLTYAEKQHLEKRLDVDYIDKELTKMRKQQRWLPRLLWGMASVFVVLAGLGLWYAFQDGAAGWDDLFYLAPVVSGIISPFIQLRALRRKVFIYEALRELSDADEVDVTLGHVVREADALIERIVDRELELTEADPLRRLALRN